MSDLPPVVAGLRLVRLVGHGGEGEVWEARTAGGERRALKLVRPEAVAAPDQILVRGDWLRKIDHPALVRVRRTGMLAEAGLMGWGLVEMDFVDGQDLSGARASTSALRRLQPLAAALDDLHDGIWSNGTPLVHRDVKPANLVAVPDGRVVLVDCSSLCGVDRSLLTRIGTPLFAAPEVITGRIGPPADVYSFAATVVALVTGARGERLADHLEDPWAVDIPDPVRLALATDPARRPRRCAVLLDPEVVRLDDGWLPPQIGHVEQEQVPPVPDVVMGGGSAVAPVAHVAPMAPMAPVAPVVRADSLAAGSTLYDRPGFQDAAGDRSLMVPAPPPRALWPFVVLLGMVAALLAGAAIDSAQLGVSWVLASFAVSVIAHLGARRRLGPALLVPTMSWGFLLAERAATDETRRAWTRATVGGLLTASAVLGLAGIGQSGLQASVELVVTCVAVGWALTVIAVATARGQGAAVVWSRLALTPFTVIGCGLLAVAAVISSPVTPIVGSLRDSGWLAGQAGRALGAIAVFGRGDWGDTGAHAPGDLQPDAFGRDVESGSTRLVDDEWSAA